MRTFLLFSLLIQILTGFAPRLPAAASVTLYADALAAGWEDWSWGTETHSFASAAQVHRGSKSLSIQFTGGYSGVQIGTNSATPPNTTDVNTLEFWIYGSGQSVQVLAGNNSTSVTTDLTLTSAWTKVSMSLASLGAPTPITRVYWFNPTGGAQSVFYVDDVTLVSTTVDPPPTSSGPALSVNASLNRHAISPLIYGLNFPNESLAAELHLPIQRWGGNSTTRYNYLYDINNLASDWFFENYPNDNSNRAQLPNGSASDQFIEQARRTSTQVLLTVPLIGWTPKSADFSCAFSVSKYGAQQGTDQWRPDCGNGLLPNGSNFTGNDPTDTSTAITPSFVQGWMDHLIANYGTAANGGVRYYNLDNEPMLWNSTHRDVHPSPTSYDEMRTRTYDYAAAIKAKDPNAQTLGPVLWGWTAYFYSALDAAPGGSWWNNPQDRNAHGGTPFVEWYLQQMKAYEQLHAVRILDYLDLHFYPQGSGIFSSSAGNAATQALRLRSTRALWDPTYVDESWIGESVYLIPRMKAWNAANYPGTKTAISEYSWGAMGSINGALAQADVLGIFGREGLDLATLWDPPKPTDPGAYAFRMYRNADGSGHGFGETSLQAASANSEQLSVFAAQRASDGALTVMVINKTSGSLESSLTLSGFTPASSASVYRYSADKLDGIVHPANQAVSAGGFTATYPANSITLFVIPNGSGWHSMYLPLTRR